MVLRERMSSKVIKITSASDYNRKKRLKTEEMTFSMYMEFVWRGDAIFLRGVKNGCKIGSWK